MADKKIESELTSGNIRFVQNYRPALEAGSYRIETKQTVESTYPEGSLLKGHPYFPEIPKGTEFYAEKQFYVRGERFNFKPINIDSVFPPDMSLGDFEDTLPHLVFNNLTLPWERNLIMSGDENTNLKTEDLQSKNGDYPPWMALFLFDEDDPAPVPRKIPVRELLELKNEPPQGIWFPPAFELEYGENPNEECTIIDVPKALFMEICPSIEDLKLLAHGRIVKVDNKAKDKSRELSGEYSVIIGNRLPNKGKESMVHLVSLEGFVDAINDPEKKLKDFHHVRMVSFRKWRFSCNDRPESFSQLLLNLNKQKKELIKPAQENEKKPKNPLDLPLLKLNSAKAPETKVEKQVQEWLDAGYVPMNHQLRQGHNTVSLYRGPLVPLKVPAYLGISYTNQDELYYRDPVTNFLDLSYASAWQLGQLLGLKNQEFAQNLYKWKRSTKLAEIRKWEQKLLEAELNVIPNETGMLLPLEDSKKKIKDTPLKSNIETIRDNKKNPSPFKRNQPKEPESPATLENLPDEVNSFLEELDALHHVPFHYLVPEPEMLPSESLKFFYLDRNWTRALRAGALSIGDFVRKREDESREYILKILVICPEDKASDYIEMGADYAGLDQYLNKIKKDGWRDFDLILFDRSLESKTADFQEILDLLTIQMPLDQYWVPGNHPNNLISNIRENFQLEKTAKILLALSPRMKQKVKPVPDDNDSDVIHGFLLRSSVLVGWPGMEILINAPKSNESNESQPAQFVRIERMAPDIALVMFKGDIQTVTFREPGEGLHFGVDLKSGSPKKAFRELTGEAGFIKDTEDNNIIEKPLDPNEHNVIGMEDLRKKILGDSDLKKAYSSFTTAEFAFVMVEGVDNVIFDLSENKIGTVKLEPVTQKPPPPPARRGSGRGERGASSRRRV